MGWMAAVQLYAHNLTLAEDQQVWTLCMSNASIVWRRMRSLEVSCVALGGGGMAGVCSRQAATYSNSLCHLLSSVLERNSNSTYTTAFFMWYMPYMLRACIFH